MSDKKNTTEFTPYGEEWRAEMMKWKKSDLVDFIKRLCIEITQKQ